MKKIVLLFLLLLLSPFAHAQSQTKIRCQVIDAKTKAPVVYATVMLSTTNRGTHADFDGFFEIPARYFEDSEILISSIGYQNKRITLASLDPSTINVIALEAAIESLDGIELVMKKKRKKGLKSWQIIREAIQRIPENYPTAPYSYIGYYRDYQQPLDSAYQLYKKSEAPIKYVNVNEGIVQLYDAGFQTNKLLDTANQSVLYEYKSNTDFTVDKGLMIPYDNSSKKYAKNVAITPLGGNELNILHIINAIRNYKTMSFSFVDFFERDFIKNHAFEDPKTVYLNDIPLYEINFVSRKKETNALYLGKGKIVIQKGSFAIHKLDYQLFYGENTEPEYTVAIEYQLKSGMMYLNYISFNNYFEVQHPDFFKAERISMDAQSGAITIQLNKKIDPKSLKPWHNTINIRYEKKKLTVYDVLVNDEQNVLKVILKRPYILILNRKNPDFKKHFSIAINDLRSQDGDVIDTPELFGFKQFRELFVQEIVTDDHLPVGVEFINKVKPLSETIIQKKRFTEGYWMNSPLQSIRKTN